MLEVISLALPFFGLIALGFIAGRVKSLPEAGLEWMNFFLIYVALPALFYRILARTPLEKLNNIPFIVGTTLATYTVFALAFAVTFFLTRGDMKRAAIGAIIGAYGNIGYMGPGLALSALGPEAAAPVALIFLFDNLLLFTLTPLLIGLGDAQGRSVGSILVETTKTVASNPLIIATVVGILGAIFRVPIPQALDQLLAFLQNAAAPCALFTLGVTVALRYTSFGDMMKVVRLLSPIMLIKLVLHPMISLGLLTVLGTFDESWIYTAVLMACLPTALNAFIIARQYDTFVQEASNAVLLGTALSVVSLTGVLVLLKSHLVPVNLLQ